MTTTTTEPFTAQNLIDMQSEVYATNEANGWFEDGRTWGDDMALLHSEVSEILEAFRDHGLEDRTRVACTHKRFGADYDAHDESMKWDQHVCKPEGVASECADVLIRLLDTCQRYQIEAAYLPQVGYLKIGETVGDTVTVLHADITRLWNADSDLGRAQSAAVILGRLYKACDAWGVSLPHAYEAKIAHNKTRGFKHGGKRL